MAGEGENYEMDHFGEEWMNTEENTNDTSFTDRDQTMAQPDTDHSIITVGSTDTNRVRDRINNSDDDRRQDKSVINARKKFFKEELGMTVNKGDGEASKELLEQSSISRNKRSGKTDGILFKGVKVMIREKGKEGKIIRNKNTTDKRVIKVTDEYEDLLEEADNEHFRRLEGVVEETNNGPTTLEAMDDIISQVDSESERILEEREEDLQEQVREIFLTEQEVREFIGTLNPQGTSAEKIEALEIEARNYRQKAADEEDLRKRQLYESFSGWRK